MRKRCEQLAAFLSKEWLLTLSVIGFILISIYVRRLPVYSFGELQVVFFLFTLFVAVKGLESCGILKRISQDLEQGTHIPLKLGLLTFFLSMLVTNDVALIVIVPLTIGLRYERKDILVILEVLAANAGSAFTPFGNPQNLFIYWVYRLTPGQFIYAITPFVVFFLILLIIFALNLESDRVEVQQIHKVALSNRRYIYLVFLAAIIVSILHWLPWWAGGVGLIYVAIFDRLSLRIDYVLLLSLILFLGISDDLQPLLQSGLHNPTSVFAYAAIGSQFISNVPVTVVLAKLTHSWQALLWGVSVGGFGSLVGSLANIIAYRIYSRQLLDGERRRFSIKFLAINYAAFLLGVTLYFTLQLSRWLP